MTIKNKYYRWRKKFLSVLKITQETIDKKQLEIKKKKKKGLRRNEYR